MLIYQRSQTPRKAPQDRCEFLRATIAILLMAADELYTLPVPTPGRTCWRWATAIPRHHLILTNFSLSCTITTTTFPDFGPARYPAELKSRWGIAIPSHGSEPVPEKPQTEDQGLISRSSIRPTLIA